MREIKFRAWSLDDKEMLFDAFGIASDGSWWQYADQGYYVNNNNAPQEHKDYLQKEGIEIKDEFILMQYTGLKDKKRTKKYPNGQEIYEGDIVKFGTLGVVGYSEDRFIVIHGTMATRVSIKHEVVGNIYENPELTDN